MKTLYLHVGTHKTGSSAIQQFFYSNRELLKRAGYYYPIEGSYYLKTEFSQSLLAHSVIEHRPYYIKPHVVFHKVSCIRDLQRDLAQSTCTNTVISSEHFSIKYTLENMLELKSIFAPYFSVIKPIIYLRRQDLYLESSYNQLVKTGSRTETFEAFVKRYKYANYLHYIEMLAAVFGEANLIIRPFERQQLFNADVVQDFTNALGLKVGNYQPKMGNESLPIEMIEVMRVINKNFHSYQERSDFCKFLRKAQIDFDQTKYTLCSPALRKEILSMHAEGNAQIATKYLKRENGILFNEPETSELPIFSGVTLERLSEIYAQIWLKQYH